jgi:hypothetical protein
MCRFEGRGLRYGFRPDLPDSPSGPAPGDRLMRLVRVLVVNVLVFFALWCLVAGIRAIGSDLLALRGSSRTSYDWRVELPSYDDAAFARRVLAEQAVAPIEFVPFVEWRHAPFRGETLTVDERGLRVHGAREPGVPIGFFGGSAMWGEGVEDGATIPAAFDALTSGHAVTNYAEHGWTSRQNLAQLVNLVRTGELPEIVVFYDGFNDVVHLCDAANARSVNGSSQERRMHELLGRQRRNQTWALLIEPFLPDGFGEPRRDRYACLSDPERAAAIADALVRTWDLAHLVVSGHGGRFYAFLQPNAHVGAARTDFLPVEESRDMRDREQFAGQFAAIYPRIRNALASRPWATDLTDAFDGDRPIYTDTVHVNAEGNRIVAERIRARIEADRNASAASPAR